MTDSPPDYDDLSEPVMHHCDRCGILVGANPRYSNTQIVCGYCYDAAENERYIAKSVAAMCHGVRG